MERLVAVLRKKLSAPDPEPAMAPSIPPPAAPLSTYSPDFLNERNKAPAAMYVPPMGAMGLETEDPKSHAMPPYPSNSFLQPDFDMGFDPSYDSFAGPEIPQKGHMGKPLPQMLDNLPADYYYTQHID